MYDEALKTEYESERGRWMCGRCHVPLEQIAVNGDHKLTFLQLGQAPGNGKS